MIAAGLTHPAMAVPLATGITGVSAYLAQDYVATESLDLMVREYGAAPPPDALRVAVQLAGALDAAAAFDIVHGSLHPRDVLLSSDETRLTGVGIARALERVGVTAPVRRPYSPPERVAGKPWDRRADVFSLAALMHELLWARRIGGPGAPAEGSLPELPGSTRVRVDEVFAKALADDPGARYDSALEFADALKSAFPGVALSEPTPPAKKKTTAPREIRKPSEHTRLPLDEIETPAAIASMALHPPIDVAPPEPLLDLHTLETKEPRYHDVAAAAPAPGVTINEPAALSEPTLSVLEQSRSAVWPLMCALVIGLALGFAGGYGIGSSGRAVAPPVDSNAAASPSAQTPAPAVESPQTPASDVPTPVPERHERQTKPEPARPAPTSSRPERRSPTETSKNARNTTPAARRPERPASQAPAAASEGITGRLNVESRPGGAKVFLDGKLIGTTPLAIAGVSAGAHTIRLELAGYNGWASPITVSATDPNRVTASLER